MEGSSPEILLTDSQQRQLTEFLAEHQHDDSVRLRKSPNLGPMYVELELVDDADGKTLHKRVLFPT